MIAFGDAVQRLGFALLIAGYGTWAVALLVRLIIVFRTREFPASIWVVGFYARTVGTVGILVMAFGPVIRGDASWLLLLGVFIIGGPALALLIVRPVSARDLLAVRRVMPRSGSTRREPSSPDTDDPAPGSDQVSSP